MKKLLFIFAVAAVFAASIFAKNVECKITYNTVPVLKVLDSVDAYIVIYQKNKIGTGSTVIPKDWLKTSKDAPTKLVVRDVKTANEAYLSIFKKENEFYRVVLNVPKNRLSPIWGLVERHQKVEGTDKQTLEDLEL